MKTITEYQPMIFSRLAEAAQERVERRRLFRAESIAALAYIGLGLGLAFDTGYLVWNWQFWVMFAPFLVAGELVVREILQAGGRKSGIADGFSPIARRSECRCLSEVTCAECGATVESDPEELNWNELCTLDRRDQSMSKVFHHSV